MSARHVLAFAVAGWILSSEVELVRGESVPAQESPAATEAPSAREIAVLRRQMKERESTAEAAFRNAETAFLVGEYDKAIEEFLMVAAEYHDTSYRMRAVLRVGDVFYRQRRYDRAIDYYQRAMRIPSELWWPEEAIEDYARADYMIGVCYFDQNLMNRAFAHFRGFVQRHPSSRFVDRAYDFIGRGNMAMKRYGQAIEAFRMVGTATIERDRRRTIAPGDELYARVVDADVGVASRNASVFARLTTSSGDEERLDLPALGLGSSVFLGAIRTRLGPPRLTRALDEVFPDETQLDVDRWMSAADEMSTEADSRAAGLNQLIAPPEPASGATGPDAERARAELERFRVERARIEEHVRTLRQGAEELRNQSHKAVDDAFARIDALLIEWHIEEAPEPAVPEAVKVDTGGGDDKSAVSLSDTFTRDQIEQTRKEVRASPTTQRNFVFRKALLTYWREQLLLEHKTLDVYGNDTITVEYVDAFGTEEESLTRVDTIGIASDAAIFAVGPDRLMAVRAAILGDVVRIKVVDADSSITDQPDSVEVVVSSLVRAPTQERKVEEGVASEPAPEELAEDKPAVDVFAMESEEEDTIPPLVPDGAPSFVLRCIETGPYTGEFIGEFSTLPAAEAPEAILNLEPGSIARVAYRDARTASRSAEWVAVAEVEIVPASDGSHEVIEMRDAQLERRSELEKGVALAKLGKVYRELGLRLDAARAFGEAVRIVRRIVEVERDSPLGEEATFQLWEVYFASGDEEAAAEACAKLIAAFPNSPLAPHALLIMARAEREDWRRALGYLEQLVHRYGDSSVAPEAHFMMADIRSRHHEFDVGAFEAVVNRYPDNNYAAQSLLRLGEYYIERRDYARARDYLERVTLDFPDFDRLDQVSYMRGICAYRMGDVQLSYTLMHETIERYPGTSAAESAGKIVELLAKRLKR